MKYCYRFLLTILMLGTSLTPLAFSQNQNQSDFLYGVIYGSDKDIKKAQFEIQQLPLILPQYTNKNYLFKSREWYASVVLFYNESDAKTSLPIIENKYARGSFVVDLKEWCHSTWKDNTSVLNGIPYYDCKKEEKRN